MKRPSAPIPVSILVLAASAFATVPALAQVATSTVAEPTATSVATSAGTDAAPSSDPGIERGRYLVEKVAMCGQCHTPRDAKGELRMAEWLHGAPVPLLTPDGYAKKWAYKAPRIAGLPQYKDDAELITFLTTGKNRDGKEAMPPMPPYRMSEADAQAIADYLRSLP